MSEFLIGEMGNYVWYDLKSDIKNSDERIYYSVNYPGKNSFWVRPHREDGPATIYKGGYKYWYIIGVEYYFHVWCEKLNKSEEEINFLKLKWNIYE